LELADKDDSEIKLDFQTGIGTLLPAQISIRTPVDSGGRDFTFCIVVTELNEEHPNEGLLRSFSQRLVQVHEAERERVASDLHGHITQLLCAVLVHSEVVTDKLTPRDRDAMIEMKKLRKMIGEAATAVEFISRHLRPSVLDHLGLVAILKSDGTEFSERTGVQLEVASGQLTTRLPPAAELAFYRIFQESLKNVEIHAQAKHVTIQLVQLDDSVEMTIQDDGIGFDPASQNATLGFGLYYMRERAATLGGSVCVTSSYGKGTTVHARIPSREDPQGL
jgi:two-component system NarL family sensor kinase